MTAPAVSPATKPDPDTVQRTFYLNNISQQSDANEVTTALRNLLDPKVNYVPELPLGGEDPLGRHGLWFTGRHPDSGRRFELVTLPDGREFDLLGVSG